MSEYELLCWLNDYKDYYELDVVEVSISDKTFNLIGYKDGKIKKSYTKEIMKDD